MTDSTASSPSTVPVFFWAVSGLALLWNLAGLAAFFSQVMMTKETLLALPPEQQDLFRNVPAWANVAFGCAVFGGTLGCIALLLRKKLAMPLFIISILGVVVQNAYSWFMTNAFEVFGMEVIIMPAVVFIIGMGLIVLTKSATAKRWLN